MSDRVDAELRRAIKESVGRSLEGWEFTPAMRQAVLDRLAEEEPDARRRAARGRGRRLSRPVLWAAAAAAALFLAINLTKLGPRFGGVAQQGEDASLAAGNAGSLLSSPQESGSGAQFSQQGGADPKQIAPPGKMVAGQAFEAASSQAENGDDPDPATGGATSSTMAEVAAATPARIYLLVPEQAAAGPGDDPPVTAMGGRGATVTALAAPPEALDMVRVGTGAAVRTTHAIRVVDASGAPVWEQPLAGGAGPIGGGETGIAAAVGNEVYVFGRDGRQELKLTVSSPPAAIALSTDGRVAVLLGEAGEPKGRTLAVFAGSREQFRAEGLADPSFAFGPDGTLAVADHGELQLFSRDGTRLWQAPLKARGRGVAFAAGGEVIVAGGQAFHRSGQPRWEIQTLESQGVLTLGADGPVALWDSKVLTLVRPEDGAEVWTAEHGGGQTLRVAASESGDQVAILASLPDGAAVWVLDRQGGLRYSERLSFRPLAVSVAGDALLILTPQGAESRLLPAR